MHGEERRLRRAGRSLPAPCTSLTYASRVAWASKEALAHHWLYKEDAPRCWCCCCCCCHRNRLSCSNSGSFIIQRGPVTVFYWHSISLKENKTSFLGLDSLQWKKWSKTDITSSTKRAQQPGERQRWPPALQRGVPRKGGGESGCGATAGECRMTHRVMLRECYETVFCCVSSLRGYHLVWKQDRPVAGCRAATQPRLFRKF